MIIITQFSSLGINPEEWHKQSSRWGNPLHSICSYMASFPPKLPHYFIYRFTVKGDLVLDPFSGRGTTVLEAALMGRHAIGSDLNPIAYILTKAKLNVPSQDIVLERIEELKKFFEKVDISDVPEDIRMLYSEKVLHQLKFLKYELDYQKSNVDTFIMAIILGAMHGDSTSSRPSYLSIPMPNTFSMSPNYVKRYIKTHNLKPPSHDVFETLEYRVRRIYRNSDRWFKNYIPGEAYLMDARNIKKILRDRKVSVIFTSPPYLKVIRYGRMNWIRLWMLDENPKNLDEKLDDKHTLPKYIEFMKEILNIFYDVLKDDGLAFVVLGDVNYKKKKNNRVILGDIIKKELEDKIKLEFVDIINDYYSNNRKVSKIWGEKKGRATRYDQILVLTKDLDLIDTKKYPIKVDW